MVAKPVGIHEMGTESDLRCDSQDLPLRTAIFDGVALSGRPLGGANKRPTLALSSDYIIYHHVLCIEAFRCRWPLKRVDYLVRDLQGEVHAAQRSLKARLGAQRVQDGIHLQ
jgi:hypothetical protein